MILSISACSTGAYKVTDAKTNEIEPVTVVTPVNPEMMQLEQSLNQSMKDISDVEVLRVGDQVLVTLPSDAMFAVGSAAMADDVTAVLYPFVKTANQYPDTALRVEGFTDSSGPVSSNMKLSLARAEQVANYLQQNDVSQERITIEGYGASYPVADNESDEGKAANRRIVITFSLSPISDDSDQATDQAADETDQASQVDDESLTDDSVDTDEQTQTGDDDGAESENQASDS